jgi:hypothetical protein
MDEAAEAIVAADVAAGRLKSGSGSSRGSNLRSRF